MIRKLFRKLLFSRPTRWFIVTIDSIVLPGCKGFSIYKILHFFLRAIRDGKIVMRASAISFKLFMAFFPMIIMLLTLIPFIPIADLQEQILRTFSELLPDEVYVFVEETLKDLVKKRGTLLSFSFLVVLWLASNSMNAILAGFGGSSNLITQRTLLKQRLLSIGLLIILSLMFFAAILLITLSGSAFAYFDELGWQLGALERIGVLVAKWLIILLLISGSIATLFNAGDTMEKRFQFISPGVLLSTLLVVLASQLLAWMFQNITDYNALYGSIGAIIAVQFWIYTNMIILLVGFELDTSIEKAQRDHAANLRLKQTTSI